MKENSSRTMKDTTSTRVAVIGAGPIGLAVMKSLMEEGFLVTGFEKRSAAGGLWTFSDDPRCTSATSSTRFQLSRFVSPMTDYPMPDEFARHPKASELAAYYQSYARHFGMQDRIEFGKVVTSVRPQGSSGSSIDGDNDEVTWLLQVEGEAEPRVFDKVVVSTGTENTPYMPAIEGEEVFRGRILHSREFKRPEDFKGLRVVVLGQGNTAADCAVDLVTHASKVYLSHRRGAFIIPRTINGERFDRSASWRGMKIMFWLAAYLPFLHRALLYLQFLRIERQAWGWGWGWGSATTTPEDSAVFARWTSERDMRAATNIAAMLVNDDLVPLLRAGSLASVRAVRRVVGPRDVQTEDGSVLRDVDAIVICTGYRAALEEVLAPGIVDYYIHSNNPKEEKGANGGRRRVAVPDQPRLFQNIFPPRWASSLACLNYAIVMSNAAVRGEVAGMAVAQVWAGKSPLPPLAEMEAQAERQVRWFARRCVEMPIAQHDGLLADAYGYMRFINRAAGTGVDEYLGWTWKGVGFCLREPRLWFTMAWGVNSPHIYRVFETGKRKAWSGAREATWHINEQSDFDLGKKTPPPKAKST